MSSRHRVFHCKKIFPIVLGSIGIGMIGVILLPFWLWIIAIGAGLVAYAWYLYFDK